MAHVTLPAGCAARRGSTAPYIAASLKVPSQDEERSASRKEKPGLVDPGTARRDNATVMRIAERAGVGVGTIYRNFPTRADLVTAVYRHQIDTCTALAPRLLEESASPFTALTRWAEAFVEFLVTKHGLGAALGSGEPGLENLHALMLDTLVPACATLLDACVAADEVGPDITAYTLMRAIGNLCVTGPDYDRADAARMVAALLAGCRRRP